VTPITVGFPSADGTPLAADLWPAPPGAPAVVAVPGLGSVRGNHHDFGALCAARGWAALALDLRGHGDSGGGMDGGMLGDVLAALHLLRGRGHTRLGLRGSSMGGFLVLNAAVRDPDVRAVVAICPARPESLAGKMHDPWPLTLPLEAAVATPGPARGFWQATGDEVVPWGGTFHLAQQAPHPRRLRVVLGGHHRSLQHDPSVLADTTAFLAAHLDR
jgi:alpha-beta hydrolase superfamily lysophospholipase